jgi:hypothetical protein
VDEGGAREATRQVLTLGIALSDLPTLLFLSSLSITLYFFLVLNNKKRSLKDPITECSDLSETLLSGCSDSPWTLLPTSKGSSPFNLKQPSLRLLISLNVLAYLLYFLMSYTCKCIIQS